MQVGILEVHYLISVGILNEAISNVPLFWDRPIEYWRPRRHLKDLYWNLLLNHRQSSAKPIPRNAPAYRVKGAHKSVHFFTDVCQILLIGFAKQAQVIY